MNHGGRRGHGEKIFISSVTSVVLYQYQMALNPGYE